MSSSTKSKISGVPENSSILLASGASTAANPMSYGDDGTETSVKQVLIPAGTLEAGDMLLIHFAVKTAVNIVTSNAFPSVRIGTDASTATNNSRLTYSRMVNGTSASENSCKVGVYSTSQLNGITAAATYYGAGNPAKGEHTTNIDTTADMYIDFTMLIGTSDIAGNTHSLSSYSVEIRKAV